MKYFKLQYKLLNYMHDLQTNLCLQFNKNYLSKYLRVFMSYYSRVTIYGSYYLRVNI